mmetsp:Transcript_93825/g.297765  ORF Transcript_93825/g.297765 Transcript_93825/m.297765 type:complete len:281 (+) Transcript_93825:353-1195(+)
MPSWCEPRPSSFASSGSAWTWAEPLAWPCEGTSSLAWTPSRWNSCSAMWTRASRSVAQELWSRASSAWRLRASSSSARLWSIRWSSAMKASRLSAGRGEAEAGPTLEDAEDGNGGGLPGAAGEGSEDNGGTIPSWLAMPLPTSSKSAACGTSNLGCSGGDCSKSSLCEVSSGGVRVDSGEGTSCRLCSDGGRVVARLSPMTPARSASPAATWTSSSAVSTSGLSSSAPRTPQQAKTQSSVKKGSSTAAETRTPTRTPEETTKSRTPSQTTSTKDARKYRA